MTDEDIFMQKRLLDLSEQSYRNSHYTFTGFLTLAEQDLFYQLLAQRPGMEYTISGGSEGCERCLIRFGSEESLGYEEPFPIVCLEIAPALKKFAEDLGHRDFLGALMHLGIDRSTLGDIRLGDGKAYLFCLAKVSGYIVENLTKIRHTVVRCRILDEIPEQSKPQVTEETIIVSSLRLDGIVAKLYHLSRSQSLLLFREKKVFVDGRCMENNSGICKEGSIVSVRGYGRFVYQGLVHETKKGNLSIQIGRYGGVH